MLDIPRTAWVSSPCGEKCVPLLCREESLRKERIPCTRTTKKVLPKTLCCNYLSSPVLVRSTLLGLRVAFTKENATFTVSPCGI